MNSFEKKPGGHSPESVPLRQNNIVAGFMKLQPAVQRPSQININQHFTIIPEPFHQIRWFTTFAQSTRLKV